MRIGMILDSEYPGSLRVRRQARALMRAGHQVVLVARNRAGETRREQVDGVDVIRLPGLRFAGRRAARWLSAPLPVNPFYVRAIYRLVRTEKVDVLHVHGLPLVMTAVACGRLGSTPVIFDLHSDYPSVRAENARSAAAKLLFRRSKALRHLERLSLANADHCLVSVEEQRARLLQLGVSADRITVVPNLLDLGDLPQAPDDPPESDGRVHFVYSGALDAGNGLDHVIEAMRRLPRSSPIQLTVVGDGSERALLEATVHAAGLDGKIGFEGAQPRHRLGRFLAQADVGIVPEGDSSQLATEMPDEVYELLAFGLPLLTSQAPPLKRLITAARCGETVDVEDARALADSMSTLAEDHELRHRHGDSGRAYVVNRNNWTVHGVPALLSAYQRFCPT